MGENRQRYVRAKLFIQAADLATPLIRNYMLGDRALVKELGLKLSGNITLDPRGPEFSREAFVSAVKSVTDSGTERSAVTDTNGIVWNVEKIDSNGRPGLGLRSSTRAIKIDDLALLSSSPDLRLSTFDSHAADVNLPEEAKAMWRAILEARALDEEELALASDEITENPIPRMRLIDERLSQGGIGADTLAPRSLRYYERLVGVVGPEDTMAQYAADVLDGFISKLFDWNRLEGTKLSLLLAGHHSVIPIIEKLPLTCEELLSLLQWALEDGDLVSRTALAEIVIKRGDCSDPLKETLSKLIDLFINPNTEHHDQFELYSSAFVATYGELALTGIMRDKSVFWRRLAALGQAAIICRAVQSQKRELKKFVGWMMGVRPTEYLMQCYVDYRTDPRWMAEFAFANQLLNEFAGRVAATARAHPDNVEKYGLTDVLTGEGSSSLASKLTPMLTILSGPLEGGVASVGELRPDEIEQLRNDLAIAGGDVEAFSVVVSAVLIAKLPPEFAELVARAIQRAQYKFDKPNDPNLLGTYIRALAQFAAISKSVTLADALFVMIRNYRRHYPDELQLTEAFTTGIIACASRTDFNEWCRAVGDFINDFSFGRLTKDEAGKLFHVVLSLCNMMPELWAAAGEGLAAIESVA
jgi:hypothetical protein